MADVYVPERWKEVYETAKGYSGNSGSTNYQRVRMLIEELGAAEQRALIAERALESLSMSDRKWSLQRARQELISEGLLPAQQQKDSE